MGREKPRTLEDVCGEQGDFVLEIQGNIYCSLAMTRKIDCIHHSSIYPQLKKDHNELYFCTNQLFNPYIQDLFKDIEV